MSDMTLEELKSHLQAFAESAPEDRAETERRLKVADYERGIRLRGALRSGDEQRTDMYARDVDSLCRQRAAMTTLERRKVEAWERLVDAVCRALEKP